MIREFRYRVFFLLTVLGALIIAWGKFNTPIPVVELLPCIVAVLFVPGFILSQLAFPFYSKKLETIELIPFWFGLSVSLWVITALFAFRFQMSLGLIINATLMLDIAGLLILFLKKKFWHSSDIEYRENAEHFEWEKFYKFVFIFLVLSCSLLVAYKSQFHRLDFDTWFHLANIRKIVDNANVIGGMPFFGLGDPGAFAYSSHAWYLISALISKMTNVSISWNYVVMSGVLTILFLFVNYALLKTILPDRRIALFAAIAMISIWLYTFAHDLQILNSIRLEFLAYPHEFPQLVLFPLLLISVLKYVRAYKNELWLVITLFSAAVIGMDSLFVFWVPVFVGMPLLISCFFNISALDRAKTVTLVAEIILIDILLLCLQTSFPLTLSYMSVPISSQKAVHVWSKVMPMWVLNDNFFAAHPIYFFNKAWKDILALLFVVTLIYYQSRLNIVKGALKKGSNVRFIATLCAISVGYYLILFNPLLVPPLLKLFIWPYPFYRMPDSIVVLSNSVIYSALACVLFVPLFFFRCFNKKIFRKSLPIIILIVCGLSPLLFRDVRTIMKEALLGNTNPNILNLSDKHPYAELSRLEKGVVAVDMLKAESVVALTPHYVVSVLRNSDISSAEQRMADNINILSYNVDSEEMKKLLLKYACKYVVVPKDSVTVQKFRDNAILFNEVADTGTDIIYSVNL